MAQDSNTPSPVEQAVSRALRENLERIQRTSDELHQAVGDVVAACASSKPANALPPLLRAQTAAASVSAALEVLSRFVAIALQAGPRSPFEAQISQLISTAAAPEPVREPVRPAPQAAVPVAHVHGEPVAHPAPAPTVEPLIETQSIELLEQPPIIAAEPEPDTDFDVNRLSPEEQELHRRANRVAKVSMQDIKMLRPEQVRLGREKKDLCIRLKDDIEKAHREYDRRFKPIMDHPVDYFYRWMVEILADGDPHALGDYPYATPARHH
jgi:hypothetical protein